MKWLPYPVQILHATVIGLVVVLSVTVTSIARSKQLEELPDVLERSIRSHFPNAQIQEFEHHRRIIQFVEVTVVDHDQEYDLTLSPDGSVLFIENEIAPGQLPNAVHDALQQMMGSVSIDEAEQMVVHADFQPVPLTHPRIQYEVEFQSKGRNHEMTVLADGTLVTSAKRLKWKDDE